MNDLEGYMSFTLVSSMLPMLSECLLGTRSFFTYGEDGQKVRDFPMIASRGREGKQVALSIPKDDASTKMHF